MAYTVARWETTFENNRTRELKRLDWVPVPNRMDDLGYVTLVTHPNGAAHLGAWLAILEIASRQKVRGSLPTYGQKEDLNGLALALAAISRLPASVFHEVLPRLRELQWIHGPAEISQDGAEIPQEGATPHARASLPFPSLRGGGAGEGFEDFWAVWWNKTAKEAARKAWPSVVQQFGAEFLAAEVLNDRQRWEGRTEWEWRSKLHPATWLRGKRWEDQLPPDVIQKRRGDYKPDVPPPMPMHTAAEERQALEDIANNDPDPSAREFARRKLATA